MQKFLWIGTLTFFFLPLATAQDLEQLRQTVSDNIPATLPDDLDRKPPAPELVQSCKAVFDAATLIYALPNLDDTDRRWTLQREAVALIVLAYSDPPKYYSRLALIVDDLEQHGLAKVVQVAEKHVLEIGSLLATKPGNTAITIDIGSLANRMVYYADQYRDADSMSIIERFLQRIRSMNSSSYRDRRLAIAAPVFRDYYQRINRTARAAALEPDIARSTLPGQFLPISGVTLNGDDFDPASMQDKVVLLCFWGTWCVHCKEEMPSLIALYNKYRDFGFEIIGVNTGAKGDSEEKVKQFVDTPLPNGNKIPWTILHEGLSERKYKGMSMTKFYGIDELPVMILIGRNGKVLDLHPIPSTLDARIAEVTSLMFAVESELTDEEKKERDEARKKQQEEADRQIRTELSIP
jgi:thiol-disulfide isomerase/thioredoxin